MRTMKKWIAILTLVAFAVVPAVLAGDGKCCDKDKAGQPEKGCCPAGAKKKGCCPQDGAAQKSAPAKDKAPATK
jgi:hypothetical protein